MDFSAFFSVWQKAACNLCWSTCFQEYLLGTHPRILLGNFIPLFKLKQRWTPDKFPCTMKENEELFVLECADNTMGVRKFSTSHEVHMFFTDLAYRACPIQRILVISPCRSISVNVSQRDNVFCRYSIHNVSNNVLCIVLSRHYSPRLSVGWRYIKELTRAANLSQFLLSALFNIFWTTYLMRFVKGSWRPPILKDFPFTFSLSFCLSCCPCWNFEHFSIWALHIALKDVITTRLTNFSGVSFAILIIFAMLCPDGRASMLPSMASMWSSRIVMYLMVHPVPRYTITRCLLEPWQEMWRLQANPNRTN